MLQKNETTRLAPPPPLDVGGHALFLDLDGTLVDFAAHPEQVVASEELRLLLANVAREMHGAVALVTGRTIASADAVLDGALVHVAGIHGLERRDAQSVERALDDRAPIEAALTDARVLIAKHALQADIEDKGLALALHYRRAPELAEVAEQAIETLLEPLRPHYEVMRGDRVLEIKPADRDKATAVEAFMREEPFAGRRPVYVGDDLTDSDGFSAVRRFDGVSVAVGDRVNAQWRLADPSAVRSWLAALATGSGSRS